ncbi:hypothetical protein TRICI_002535, partial [Trichomonascus ciferrii]
MSFWFLNLNRGSSMTSLGVDGPEPFPFPSPDAVVVDGVSVYADTSICRRFDDVVRDEPDAVRRLPFLFPGGAGGACEGDGDGGAGACVGGGGGGAEGADVGGGGGGARDGDG